MYEDQVSKNRAYLLAELIGRHSLDPRSIQNGRPICRCGQPWIIEHPYESALAVLDYHLSHNEHRTDARNLPECCVAHIENEYRKRLIATLQAETYKSLEAGESPVALGIMNVIIQLEMGVLP